MPTTRPAQWEASRVAALLGYDVLDTPRERDFDEVAALASEICGTPIAVVNLIGEDRQFFKAEVGLGVRETPLESSFCAKAILEEDFLVVPDATKDARFDCNPLVTGEPNLRFYAGALLKTDEGLPIGTVCVLDFQPRSLTPLQERTLRVLANQVMAQLELRKTIRDRQRAQARQNLLNKEIVHRLKNTMAMVQAIANQTLAAVEDRKAVEAFGDRLLALSKAHDVLMQESWTEAPLGTVARLVLEAHDATRVTISGPDVQLGPRATLSMSLLLHELATNAAKHGALSVPSGGVTLSWDVERGADQKELVVQWKEAGGPEVVEPSVKGFGARLLRMGLVGRGGADKRYLPGGFTATFRAPMDEVTAL